MTGDAMCSTVFHPTFTWDCVPQSHQSWLYSAVLHPILIWDCVPWSDQSWPHSAVLHPILTLDCVPQSDQSWLYSAALHPILTWNCVPQWPIMTPLCSIQFCVKATHLYMPNITCMYLLSQETEISYVVNCLAFNIHCVKWTSNCENNWRGCR